MRRFQHFPIKTAQSYTLFSISQSPSYSLKIEPTNERMNERTKKAFAFNSLTIIMNNMAYTLRGCIIYV